MIILVISNIILYIEIDTCEVKVHIFHKGCICFHLNCIFISPNSEFSDDVDVYFCFRVGYVDAINKSDELHGEIIVLEMRNVLMKK